MLIPTTSIDIARLKREAQDWGRNYSTSVSALVLHGDDIITHMIELTMNDGSRYLSGDMGDFGQGSEFIVFHSVYDTECTARFFINGI